jgi:hypothetical protein
MGFQGVPVSSRLDSFLDHFGKEKYENEIMAKLNRKLN